MNDSTCMYDKERWEGKTISTHLEVYMQKLLKKIDACEKTVENATNGNKNSSS